MNYFTHYLEDKVELKSGILTLFILAILSIGSILPMHANSQDTHDDQDVYALMMSRIQQEFEGAINLSKLETDIPEYLITYNASNGSFTDVDYSKKDRTNWEPLIHVDRLYDMSFAYTMPGNTYYKDEGTYNTIVQLLQYWYDRNPECANWWYNQIATPQRLGKLLIQLRKGEKQVPAELERLTLERMRTDGGNPASQTGPNKTDIALHWLYRACLTKDAALMSRTMEQAYLPIKLVTGEGIQHDYSYFQHGRQFYVGGYGDELIKGILMFVNYTVGTQFAFGGEQLEIFSKFVRETYYKVIRGRYIHFNVLGRGMSRVNATRKGSGFAQNLITVDPTHADEYRDIVKRIKEEEAASYGIKPNNTTYYVGDYVIHTRPEYQFGVRTVSNRTLRNEYGNGENLKTYFLSDGSTHITQKGDEYFNIFPVWDWARIPGVTNPQYTTIPKAASDMSTPGTSSFAGGVSDSLYSANTYSYIDNYSGINTKAKKSWFFFDEEVVALGVDISSLSTFPLNTTVEQNLLKGEVIVSSDAGETTLSEKKEHTYDNNLKWVLHNNMGYVFPKGGKINIKNVEQKGSWFDINTTQSKGEVKSDVFTLWLDHGQSPQKAHYAYIVVPNKKTAQEMKDYKASDIEILANTDSVQVVRHKGLNIWQMIFFKAATFEHGDIIVKSDKGAALILKNIGTPEVKMHIADPAQKQGTIIIATLIPSVSSDMKQTVCDFSGTGVHAGRTAVYAINIDSENYVPKEPGDDGPDEVYESALLADAFVQNGTTNAGSNFGSNNTMIVKLDGIGYNREGYIKVSLEDLDKIENLAEQRIEVKLSLYLTNGNTGISGVFWNIYPVEDTSWEESALTWNNRPAAGTTLITQQRGFQPDPFDIGPDSKNIVKFDVTGYALAEYAKGNKVLSFNITNDKKGNGKHDSQFATKENETLHTQPKLVVNVYKKEVIPEPDILFESISVDDSFVRDGTYSDDNYGDRANAVVKADGEDYHREAYMKFSLGDIDKIEDKHNYTFRISLSMYLATANTGVGTIYWDFRNVEDTEWSESTLTWNNRPAAGSNLLAHIKGFAPDLSVPGFNLRNVIEFDITDYALSQYDAGIKSLSINISNNEKGDSKHDSEFSTKENSNALMHPKIIVRAYRKGNIDDTSIKSLEVNGEPWDIDQIYVVPRNFNANNLTIKVDPADGATVSTGNEFAIHVGRPSLQKVDFVVTAADGQTKKSYGLTVEKRFNFNALIVTRWNNTLAVINNNPQEHEFTFTGYQWFQNGRPIDGATQQYYSAGKNGERLSDTDEYYVEVVDAATGQKLRCWEAKLDLKEMRTIAYPNPARQAETVTIDADIEDELLVGASIVLYNSMGHRVASQSVIGRKTDMIMPSSSGVYFLRFEGANGYRKQLKLIVK